jgi:hypothetical protein
LLIADEFHFLTPTHKRELISWVELRVSWLKCVMLANRHTAFDVAMLREAGERLERSIVSIPEPFLCRLSMDKVIEVAEKEKPTDSQIRFLHLWFGAARGLFGDEALSLRYIQTLLRLSQGATHRELAALVAEKIPSVSNITANAFAKTVWDMWKNIGVKESCKFEFSREPHELLIQVAQSDTQQERLTYPQFCALDGLGAFRRHPLARLKSWAALVLKKSACGCSAMS